MHTAVFSQNFNVQEITKAKLINVTGGAGANTVFRTVNDNSNPFSYFLNGNINVNIAGVYNLPFSFSYTNQKLGYNKPVLMNRLSVHPSYKWITAHIGDASMTFSPYTLSGHQFSGFGVDLTPKGKFKISAMYGRFVKKIAYDPLNTQIQPAYKRTGFGFKSQYAFSKFNAGMSFIKIKDQKNQDFLVPIEIALSPKENVAISLDASFTLRNKLQITAEIANSSITEDANNNSKSKTKGPASLFLNSNATTVSNKAIKANFNYPAGNGTLGLGYERIDPNYKTLGGYFFNNDLENITINATQSLYKNKVALSLNFGLQKDNLKNQKQSQMKRLVSNITTDVKPNDKLNFNVNYSNFQSYTNSRNQFDYINQASNFEFLDTLNYRQINQNASLAINYLLKSSPQRKQAINANFSLQGDQNQQDGKTVSNGANTYLNSGLSYSLGFPEKAITINTAINATNGKSDANKTFTWGPTLGVNKQFFDKKLNSSFATSYNTSSSNGTKQSQVINLRLNGSYVYAQKHNFSASMQSLFASSKTSKNNNFTATVSYSYSFDKIKMKWPKKESEKIKKDTAQIATDTLVKIRYKETTLNGNKNQIVTALTALQNKLQTTDATGVQKLKTILESVTPALSIKNFKPKALDYLEQYDALLQTQEATKNKKTDTEVTKKIPEDREQKINTLTITTVKKYLDNVAASYEAPYTIALARVQNHPMHQADSTKVQNTTSYKSYLKLVERAKISQQKAANFLWIKQQINYLHTAPKEDVANDPHYAAFMQTETPVINQFIQNKKNNLYIVNYLEKRLFAHYKEVAAKTLPTETTKNK